MNKVSLLLILTGILVLSGCSVIQSGPVCNKPYILVGEECCLDSNDNGICDVDDKLSIGASSIENLKAELKEEITAQLRTELENISAKSASNLELTADYCSFSDFTGAFQCRYGFLWNDGVEVKLRSSESGRAVLKKIWFTELDCGMDFPQDDKYAIGYNEDVLVEVPCNITKSSVYNNKMELTIDYHQKRPGGGYFDESSEMVLKGELGGIVRDRETLFSASAAQVAIVEVCETLQWPFDCTRHEIGKDYIELRLKSAYLGIVVPKRIEFLSVPCNYTFEDVSRENGFKFGDERAIKVKCDIKREFVASEIEMQIDKYLYTTDSKGQRTISETPLEQLIMGGWVEGIVPK